PDRPPQRQGRAQGHAVCRRAAPRPRPGPPRPAGGARGRAPGARRRRARAAGRRPLRVQVGLGHRLPDRPHPRPRQGRAGGLDQGVGHKDPRALPHAVCRREARRARAGPRGPAAGGARRICAVPGVDRRAVRAAAAHGHGAGHGGRAVLAGGAGADGRVLPAAAPRRRPGRGVRGAGGCGQPGARRADARLRAQHGPPGPRRRRRARHDPDRAQRRWQELADPHRGADRNHGAVRVVCAGGARAAQHRGRHCHAHGRERQYAGWREHIHGGDARDGRAHAPGDPAVAGHPGRARPRHQHARRRGHCLCRARAPGRAPPAGLLCHALRAPGRRLCRRPDGPPLPHGLPRARVRAPRRRHRRGHLSVQAGRRRVHRQLWPQRGPHRRPARVAAALRPGPRRAHAHRSRQPLGRPLRAAPQARRRTRTQPAARV
ncbi:hypothetical protein IWQ56_005827, partial [Coemansia nantahalensis]